MDSSGSRLSRLQRELLDAFFRRERRMVLTGGGALIGFHLKHRTSNDLDLFGRPGIDLELIERALEDAAASCGAALSAQVRYRDFRRFLCTRRQETTLVDLVVDRTTELDPHKLEIDGIRVDTLREIAANKVCTILSRCEIRDLVDLKAILQAGIRLEDALRDAATKDLGVNPATLAWLLSELSIDPDAAVPESTSPEELEAFRRGLVEKLRRLAFPG